MGVPTAPPPESGPGRAGQLRCTCQRIAEPKPNCSDLAELFRRYREEIAGERGAKVHLAKEAFFEPLEARMATMLGDGRQLAALGTIDEVPVAMALGHLEELGDSSLLAVLDVLYVDKGCSRGRHGREHARLCGRVGQGQRRGGSNRRACPG